MIPFNSSMFLRLTIIFTCLYFCQVDISAQICSDIQRYNNQEDDSRNLVFSERTIVLNKGERGVISPNCNRAAILKWADHGDLFAIMKIYNEKGIEIGQHKVLPLDKVAIADDGRFVVYGFRLSPNGQKQEFALYDKNGKVMVRPLHSFSSIQRADFIPKTNSFFFCGQIFSKKSKINTILLYDEMYNKKLSQVFYDWHIYSTIMEVPIINENKKSLTLHLKTKYDSHIDFRKKETFVIGFDGEVISKELDWK